MSSNEVEALSREPKWIDPFLVAGILSVLAIGFLTFRRYRQEGLKTRDVA